MLEPELAPPPPGPVVLPLGPSTLPPHATATIASTAPQAAGAAKEEVPFTEERRGRFDGFELMLL